MMLADLVVATADKRVAQRWQALCVPCQRVMVCPSYAALLRHVWRANSCCILDLAMGSELEHHTLWHDLSKQVSLCLYANEFSIEEELHWLAAGIRACCTPELDDERLKVIVEVTAQGGIWVSNQALPQLMQGLQRFSHEPSPLAAAAKPATSSLNVLTPQERKIAQLVGQGESNKLIARALNISDHTVKTHLSAIFSKLHLNDRVHLALLVNQEGENRP